MRRGFLPFSIQSQMRKSRYSDTEFSLDLADLLCIFFHLGFVVLDLGYLVTSPELA